MHQHTTRWMEPIISRIADGQHSTNRQILCMTIVPLILDLHLLQLQWILQIRNMRTSEAGEAEYWNTGVMAEYRYLTKATAEVHEYTGINGYIITGGLTFDKDNNLWVVSGGNPKPLAVRHTDGSWESFVIPSAEFYRIRFVPDIGRRLQPEMDRAWRSKYRKESVYSMKMTQRIRTTTVSKEFIRTLAKEACRICLWGLWQKTRMERFG